MEVVLFSILISKEMNNKNGKIEAGKGTTNRPHD